MNSPLTNYPPDFLFPDGLNPQMPEVYNTFLQVKRYNKMWWDGGLADQPYFLQMELDACANGESEYEHVNAPLILSYAEMKKES